MRGSPSSGDRETKVSSIDTNSKPGTSSTALDTNKTQAYKVREDVYLIQKSVADKNLLKNSISAKLKQNIPGELSNRKDVINKLRRENLKEYLRLSSLNKKFNSEMQMEKNRISSEGSQLIKRQHQMRRNSDLVRKNQEKMKTMFENRKNSSTLPHITYNKPVAKHIVIHHSPDGSDFQPRSDRPSTYPRYPIDKDDATFIKVFKHNGIFQPQNKYPDKHSIRKPENRSSILKRGAVSQSPEYEVLTLSLNDYEINSEETNTNCSQENSPREKKKSARRVTWSGVEREQKQEQQTRSPAKRTPDLFSPVDGRSEINSTPCSQKSFKSDTALYKSPSFRKNRSKIGTIGIQWKLPPGSKLDNLRSRSAGNVSRNLNPCATAMNKGGTSISRTRWQVPRPQSLESYELYKIWLDKLEKLKSPTGERMIQVEPRAASCNAGGSMTLSTITEPLNMSVFTGGSNI